MGQWNGINNEITGIMQGISNAIYQNEITYPDLLPNIRNGNTIFITSDYSGQQYTSLYEAYTFLYVDSSCFWAWEAERKIWRSVFLPDGRRLTYKSLNDKKCKKSLKPFLDTTKQINGLIAAILVDKNIPTIFFPEQLKNIHDTVYKDCSHWKKPTFEKLLRISHFASLFLSGLSKPYQNVFWISDEDEIIPNNDRLREATTLCGYILSNYLNHTLGHIRLGSTKVDAENRMFEDLVSIPDLASGFLANYFTMRKKQGILPKTTLMIPTPQNTIRKNKVIGDWFSDNRIPLKHIVFMIGLSEDQKGLTLQHIRFHGSKDFFPMNCAFLKQNAEEGYIPSLNDFPHL